MLRKGHKNQASLSWSFVDTPHQLLKTSSLKASELQVVPRQLFCSCSWTPPLWICLVIFELTLYCWSQHSVTWNGEIIKKVPCHPRSTPESDLKNNLVLVQLYAAVERDGWRHIVVHCGPSLWDSMCGDFLGIPIPTSPLLQVYQKEWLISGCCRWHPWVFCLQCICPQFLY